LERSPLSLVSTTEELLGSNSSGSGLESRECGSRDSYADHVAPSIRKKLALTSLTSGGRSVGIACLRTEVMEFFLTSEFPFSYYFWCNVFVSCAAFPSYGFNAIGLTKIHKHIQYIKAYMRYLISK
jgi:hypothetical protein